MAKSDVTFGVPISRDRRSLWSYYPWFFGAVMLAVVAVNTVFIVDAVSSFPGAADNDGFDMSNDYNQVLRATAFQHALGWDIRADAVLDGQPLLILVDKDGAPLIGATVTGNATRPLGPPMPQPLAFRDVGAAHYAAAAKLPLQGQWDLALRIQARGQDVRVTRRIVIK